MTNTTNEQAPAGGFSADWLRLREPVDLAARSQALAQGFKAALSQRPGEALRLIDLAAGAGANFRALAPVLQADQHWTLIDHDPLLLAAQRAEIAAWARQHAWPCVEEDGVLHIDAGTARWQVRGQQLDLARDLEQVDLHGCDGLVTTAFLDLVSASWLDRLATMLRDVPRPLLATLTVDGQRTWLPERAGDELIRRAFLAHQGGDKGFGESLGGLAAGYLAERLAGQGCRVSIRQSDWRIESDQPEMLLAMAQEAADVASEVNARDAAAASAWLTERAGDLDQGVLTLVVGHLDLLAVPA